MRFLSGVLVLMFISYMIYSNIDSIYLYIKKEESLPLEEITEEINFYSNQISAIVNNLIIVESSVNDMVKLIEEERKETKNKFTSVKNNISAIYLNLIRKKKNMKIKKMKEKIISKALKNIGEKIQYNKDLENKYFNLLLKNIHEE